MNTIRKLNLIVGLTLSGAVIVACSSAAPNTPAAPTATASPLVTSAPVALNTATLAPLATVLPTAATMKAAGGQSDSPLGSAIAKTMSATVFRLSAKMTVLGAIAQFIPVLPTDKEVTLVGTQSEFSGRDSHQKQTGLGALMFMGDLSKTLESIQIGDKMYLHGPAAALSAPADKWYLLDPSSGMTLSFPPPDTLSQLASANGGDWSHFTKTRSGDKLDGKTCDIYCSDASSYAASWKALNKNNPAGWIADSGTAELAVCDDGYVHNFSMTGPAHDQKSPDQKGQVTFLLHYYDFNGNVAITAPADAVAIKSDNAAPTAAPAATKSATIAAPSNAVSKDGDWQGTYSKGGLVSFTVAQNQITDLDINYNVLTNGCTLAGSFSRTPDKTLVNANTWSVQVSDNHGRDFTFTANFASNSQASGTLQVKGTSDICGNVDSTDTWTASQVAPIPTKAAVIVPTAAKPLAPPATPSGPAADAGAIVTGFFNQINAKNVDGALSFFGDGFIVTWGTAGTFVDKTSLKTFLNTLVSRGMTYQTSNVKVTSNTFVDLGVQESGGGSAAYPKSSFTVGGGKINIAIIK